ncbi:unnamed protein product [Linum tenue]|uniref:Uncharacterized protein n=1 Tax=Linum tenue TaxID=586396 RepID=A0AAV0LQM4_9ROSI|nr:unnamed protein product [Linum tenue]
MTDYWNLRREGDECQFVMTHVLLDCFCSSNLVAALLVPLRVWLTAFET